MAEASIKFYRVKKCGYYALRDQQPLFGGLADTLSQLHAWVSDPEKTLRDTQTFTIEDAEGLEPTYCFDIASDAAHGSWLLTTWNETHNDQGRVPAVNGNGRVGQRDVEVTDIPAGRIPGYPTYFWLIPARSALATIRFNSLRNGHQNLREYIQQFLWKHTRYVVEGVGEDDEIRIIGHCQDPDTEDPLALHPRFESMQESVRGPVDFIRNSRERIRSIIRRNALRWEVPEERDWLLKSLSLLGFDRPRGLTGEVKTKYEIPFAPSQEELEALIDAWRHEDEAGTKWNDIGFKLTGESDIHWLGRALCKGIFELDVTPDDAGVVAAPELLRALVQRRQEVLALLP